MVRTRKALAVLVIAGCVGTLAAVAPASAGADTRHAIGKYRPQAGAGAVAAQGAGGGATACADAPVLKSARVEPGLTAAFANYANTGGAWTGGDSTYSVKLPGGRVLWLFSDTFLGEVNDDGTRPVGSPIVNNTFVEQWGSRFRTIHGGTTANPTAVIPPPAQDAWYWLGAGHYGAGTLQVVFQRYDRFGPGQWDWGFTGSVLARFSPWTYRLIDVTPLPSAAKVAWGSWIQVVGPHTYIYGVEDLGLAKYMHIARVTGGDLRAPWQYYTGTGWSADQTASVRVQSNVANEYSVTPLRGGYLLITQDTSFPFSTEVVAYFACSPTGPWTGRTTLFHTPETGGNVFTYNAHEHPELRRDGALIVTYNVNSFAWEDHFSNAGIYRPRFMEVRFE